jgi:methionine aminopeptidase
MSQIIIKTNAEIQAFRESGKYLTEILQILREAAKPGVSLFELDQIAQLYCKKHDVKASFL